MDINDMVWLRTKTASSKLLQFFLAECGVLDHQFALAIAPSTGLRNRLVHEYEEINHQIVFQSIDKIIQSYTQ